MNQSLERVHASFNDLEYNSRVQTQPECTVERTLEIIGGKWTTLILRDLLRGTKRFGELRTSLGAVSPKTLSDRLKFLEERGIVERKSYPEIPPRVEYTLTARGRDLGAIIDAMAIWGAQHS